MTQRHLDATATIPDDAGLDLVLWPENTIDITTFEDSLYHQDIAAEAARIGAPIAVGVTEDTADGEHFINAQVVVAPNGDDRRPVREGPSRAVRRVRPAARPARSVGCARRPDRPRRGRRHGSRRRRTARRHEAGRGDLVGGLLRRAGPRGRQGGRRGDPQPHQRVELHGHDRADPAGGVEPVAGRRERPLGRPGCSDRIHRGRRRRRHGARAHVDQRAACGVHRHRAAHGAHLVHRHRRRADHRGAGRWCC